MVFLEFEKPLEKLHEQLEKLRKLNEEGELDMTDKIEEIELMIQKKNPGNLFEYTNQRSISLAQIQRLFR